ncbi:MAG: sensor domain-containing diguanylate cyclase [Smithella sp.]|jgi:diguanylate cyclase (GGDEF)-like protein/PAS domain S-box-containing protein
MTVKPKAVRKPEKKKKENKDEALSHLAKAIIANTGVGIYIVQNGKFVYVSELYQKLSGYTGTELIGTYSLNNIYPDDREMVREEAIKCLKGESFEPYEYRFVKKNHKVMWVLETITPIVYKEGRATLGSFMDITERKRMGKALRHSKEKYQTILENMQEGYFEVDLTGNFTFCNDSMSQLTGHSKEKLLGMNFREYSDRETAKEIFQVCNKVYRTGEPIQGFSWQMTKKDGSKRYVEISISLKEDSSGNSIGYRGIAHDITDRKQMEEKLHHEELRFRALIEHSSDIIVIINREGIITYINPAVEIVLGFKPEERIGAKGFELVHPDDMQFLADSFNTLTRDTNYPVIKGEMHLRHKDGSWCTFEGVGSNLVINNVVESVIVNYRDITERKLAEDALRKSEQKYLELSTIDDLTQLYNSRHFYAQLENEIERSNRYEQPFTLMMMDLDKFKMFNDTYGHVEGDYVLSRVGQVIKLCLREIDSAYRYGGEEFTIILPMTASKEGIVTAKRIQEELKKEAFHPALDQKVYMTVSIGLSQYKPKEEMKAFVHRVDQLMYQAKKNGRDRIYPES